MKKSIIIFATLFMPLIALHGQERIEQIYGMHGEHSIIRELTASKWVVYSDVDKLTFSLVDDGATLVDVITLSKDFTSVSDFTILDNRYVYFCGMHNGKPVMAHFDMLTFPNTTIQYIYTTGVDTLTAIKAYTSFEYPPKIQPTHVVMIGQKKNVGILIDALSLTAGTWNTYYITMMTNDNKTVLHDAIDLLDDYVVVASKNYTQTPRNDPFYFLGTGYVWYIRKPNPQYTPMLATPEYFTIPNIIASKELKITAFEDKRCMATALAKKQVGTNYSNGIHLYVYNYPYNINTARLPYSDIYNMALKDLCFEKTKKKTELLVQYNNGTINESRIYTLTPTSYPGTTVLGRVYAGHKINSMITQTYNSEHFIGTGIDVEDNTSLDLYRYKNRWQEVFCAERLETQVEDIDRSDRIEGRRTFESITHNEVEVIPDKKITAKYIICE